MPSFPMTIRNHALYHVVHRLGMHHVIEVVSHLDGPIAAQIAIGFSVSHLVLTGEGCDKQHNILGYVFDAKHKL